MNTPYVFKRCSKCGEWLVASSVNFHKLKDGKFGLRAQCKECRKKYCEQNKGAIAKQQKEWYEANKANILEQRKKYYEENKEARAEWQKRYREQNKEAIAKKNKRYREQNKGAIAERDKEYYEANKANILEQRKKYYEEKKDDILEQHKEYYEVNKDDILERNKRYRNTPQGQVVAFNGHNRRRSKEQTQGNGITKEQWLEMMVYFDWRCAYSGKYIGGNTKDRTIDHIIPINNNGEHEIWNLVPMYRPYNSSKHDKDMLQWYKEQTFFSEERLNKIYEWQEYAYKKMHDKEEII